MTIDGWGVVGGMLLSIVVMLFFCRDGLSLRGQRESPSPWEVLAWAAVLFVGMELMEFLIDDELALLIPASVEDYGKTFSDILHPLTLIAGCLLAPVGEELISRKRNKSEQSL